MKKQMRTNEPGKGRTTRSLRVGLSMQRVVSVVLMSVQGLGLASPVCADGRAERWQEVGGALVDSVSVDQDVLPRIPLPAEPVFGAHVTDAELESSRVFREGLVTVGTALQLGSDRRTENRELADALLAYVRDRDAERVDGIEEFLEKHPKSVWRVSLRVNLGLIYRDRGYLARALESFESAWEAGKGVGDTRGKALVDLAVGEWALMLVALGKGERFERLVSEVKDLAVGGSGRQKLVRAREGWELLKSGRRALRCGPVALGALYDLEHPGKEADGRIRGMNVSEAGASLAQLSQVASEVGLSYEMAKLGPSGAFPVPSVLHARSGHFLPLTKTREVDGQRWYWVPGGVLLMEAGRWVSDAALRDEASGYALVKRGVPGMRVAAAEGSQVRGAGACAENVNLRWGPGEELGCNGDSRGMCTYSIDALSVSLNLRDTPVGYQPAYGPGVFFTARYSQREEHQPVNPHHSNLGPKWSSPWLSYIQTDVAVPDAERLHDQGWGFDIYSPSSNLRNVRHGAVLEPSGSEYTLRHADGSTEVFGEQRNEAGTTRFYLTRVVDPAGNAVELIHQGGKLMQIVSAAGEVTRLSYELPDPYQYLITKVTDPFGRFATFQYNAGKLAKITDVIGVESRFEYDPTNPTFISELTTPYGPTQFTATELQEADGGLPNLAIGRSLDVIDPLGGRERVVLADSVPEPTPDFYPTGDANLTPDAMEPIVLFSYLDHTITYHWSRKQNVLDYTEASRIRWFTGPTGSPWEYDAIGVPAHKAQPREHFVSFSYSNQGLLNGGVAPIHLNAATLTARPAKIGRVLTPYEVAQVWTYGHSASGQLTSYEDPEGRITELEYDGIDLAQVRRKVGGGWDTLASFANYTSQHLPQTMTDAAGQSTQYTYNGKGQVTSTTNANGEVTEYAYSGKGRILAVSRTPPGGGLPLITTSGYKYDSLGRVATVVGPDGAMVAKYQYDALDRLTKTSYPDGSFVETVYHPVKKLSVWKERDRLGHWTEQDVDALGRVTARRSLDNPARQISYGWCACGSLDTITDAEGKVTKFDYDIQGRLRLKTNPDMSKEEFQYEVGTSRLWKRVRPDLKEIIYTYNKDNALRTIEYPNSGGDNVTFGWDPSYPRVLSIQDGTGSTTMTYKPAGVNGAGRLDTVDGPLPGTVDKIQNEYDILGRVKVQRRDGLPETFTYDRLGRTTSIVNPLGTFHYGYDDDDGVSSRLRSIDYPPSTGYALNVQYESNAAGRWIKELAYARAGVTPLKVTYGHNSLGQITSAVDTDHNRPLQDQHFTYGYNEVGELETRTAFPGLQDNATFGYDLASNRTAATESLIVPLERAFDYDNDQLTGEWLNGALVATYTHDANGNLTSDGQRTFTYDRENRLRQIDIGNRTTRIDYNGIGQFHRIEEYEDGNLLSTRFYTWIGDQPAMETSSDGLAVSRRFYTHGTFVTTPISSSKHYYLRDHRGSVRKMVDVNGMTTAAYDYDSWGEAKKLSGSQVPPFGWSGHFRHASSGLLLTSFRAYDPKLGRWLSRDPEGKRAAVNGTNDYFGLDNDPVNRIDPDGRAAFAIPVLYYFYAAAAAAAVTTVAISASQAGSSCSSGLKGSEIEEMVTAAAWAIATSVSVVDAPGGEDPECQKLRDDWQDREYLRGRDWEKTLRNLTPDYAQEASQMVRQLALDQAYFEAKFLMLGCKGRIDGPPPGPRIRSPFR